MEDKFKDLNRFNKEISENSASILNSFAGALFKNTPWFLSNMKLNQTQLKKNNLNTPIEVPEIKEETPKEAHLEEEIRTEKEQVVNSLYEYTKNEVENTNAPVKIEGDQRTLTTSQPTLKHDSDLSEEEISGSTPDYLKRVETCNQCFKEDGEKASPCLDTKFHKMNLENIDILFVGDHPKKEGEGILSTFTSDSGDIVKRMIGAMKLEDNKWAITNIAKCFKENSDILYKKEMAKNCFQNVKNEILLLNPKVVISFGAISTNMILEKKEKLSAIHGKFFDIKYTYPDNQTREFKLVPIFHPEFLLINPNMKRSAWMDMKKVMEYLTQVS